MFATITNLIIALSIFLFLLALHRIYLHPLSKFPGPRLWALTRIPLAYNMARGRLNYRVAELHERYGPIVRIAPTELTFNTEDAWAGIYSKPPGKPQLQKDEFQFRPPKNGVKGLLFETNDVMHGRMRRNFSHAFSDRSMREQEPLITKYIDVLIQRLHENSANPLNIYEWLNFASFDIIGDLVFGESFDCLRTSTLHWWVQMLFDYAVVAALYGVLHKFGPITKITNFMIPPSMLAAEQAHKDMTVRTLNKRLAMKEPRPDFITHVQKYLNTPTGITHPELLEISRILIVGGSETTATLLSGLIYLILSNPSTYHLLVSEIRSAFTNEEDINMHTVQRLEYQLAVINETFRLFPPLPGIPRRLTPKEGCMIAGQYVPGNTLVAVDLWAAGHSASNFHRPLEFIPERWLPTATPTSSPSLSRPAEFDADKRKSIQPFSMGPRNCIGKNLAYMEIRLILARLLWGFDLSLEERSEGWMEGLRVYGFFEKGVGLWVKLSPVVR